MCEIMIEYPLNAAKVAEDYANKKVIERNEYPGYDLHRQKSLTRFDGYDVEQAFEDGLNFLKVNIWHDASKQQPEIGKPFLNRAGNIGGVTVRIRDETHILAGGNRWAYIEDILPDECDKASVVRLTVLLNKTK